MHGEPATREHRQIDDGEQQRHRVQPALADDLAAAADSIERDLHARRRLAFALQHQECVVRERRVVEADQASLRRQLEPVDEADHDVRFAVQRPLQWAELRLYHGAVRGRCIDEADADEAVQVEIATGRLRHHGCTRNGNTFYCRSHEILWQFQVRVGCRCGCQDTIRSPRAKFSSASRAARLAMQ
jgi:hypothetical protein